MKKLKTETQGTRPSSLKSVVGVTEMQPTMTRPTKEQLKARQEVGKLDSQRAEPLKRTIYVLGHDAYQGPYHMRPRKTYHHSRTDALKAVSRIGDPGICHAVIEYTDYNDKLVAEYVYRMDAV